MTKEELCGIDAIAFDLDGTLVDSAPDIRQALNFALDEAGLACFELDTVRAWIGDGPDALILQALREHGLGGSGRCAAGCASPSTPPRWRRP